MVPRAQKAMICTPPAAPQTNCPSCKSHKKKSKIGINYIRKKRQSPTLMSEHMPPSKMQHPDR